RGMVAEAFWIEIARLVATAEITRADLPDEIAAMFQMVGRDPALAGVVIEIADFRTPVQRLDRGAGEGAEAHCGDVEPRGRIRPGALVVADLDPRVGQGLRAR